MKNIIEGIRKNKIQVIIFSIILIVGVFLRTYNFHDWLHFGSDQARDAVVVENVILQQSPWPLLGADASNTGFKLGPMYHYFQIISAKIFGIGPEKMAYPDVFFAILSIPLLYLLLRKYFNGNLSLILVGLYAVSFYVIEYSRFAWNPNAIPFFVMLFLLSLLEFFAAKEKTSWWWILFIGLALGVGIQLHTLLLLLLPTIAFISFIFLMVKNRKVWKKWSVILLILIGLNGGQIKSDLQTGGNNSSLFLKAFTDRSQSGGGRLAENLWLDVLCHAQANAQIVSPSDDEGTCNFSSVIKNAYKEKNLSDDVMSLLVVLISMIFFVVGYGLLGYLAWKEKDEKRKHFLVLIAGYALFSFFIMLSIIRGAPLRYFIHTVFVPFVLLGLLTDVFIDKWGKVSVSIIAIVFLICFGSNLFFIGLEARDLATGVRGDFGYVVLGEAQRMVDYMGTHSGAGREIRLSGSVRYFSTYYKSLKYLASKDGLKIERGDLDEKNPDQPMFYIWKNDEGESIDRIKGEKIETYENFGRVGIYKLQN